MTARGQEARINRQREARDRAEMIIDQAIAKVRARHWIRPSTPEGDPRDDGDASGEAR